MAASIGGLHAYCERRHSAPQGTARMVGALALLVLLASSGCQQPPRFGDAQVLEPAPPIEAAAPASHTAAQLAEPQQDVSAPAPNAEDASGSAHSTPGQAPGSAGPEVTAVTEATADEAAAEPDLWAVLRSGFVLEHHLESPAVQAEIRWLKRHRSYFERRAQAFATYMPYVVQELSAYGIPSELALMPVIESALDPYAYSPGGAAGLWQFIDITAERFGLKKNMWYDGRRDVIAATEAAVSYLSFLHQSFDDWLLVMAGYNAGEGNVRRALRKHRARSPKDNPTFFELPLPRETRQYVPRILAYAAVIAEPARYGITLPDLEFTDGFATLELPAQFDLMKVSELLELSLDELYRWNPALNHWATPAHGPHRLIVPPGLDTAVAATRFEGIPERERMGWEIVRVRSGDSLSVIAARNGARTSDIRRINQLRSDLIRPGQQLFIPKSAAAAARYPIARLHGNRTHTVKSGDSLWKLARKHQVSISQLVRWNELNPKAPLRVGQTLHVGKTNRSVMRKVRYTVRRGDSLSRIAGRFNVRSGDIAAWNRLRQNDYLQPGQKLTLHVDVAKGASGTAVGL